MREKIMSIAHERSILRFVALLMLVGIVVIGPSEASAEAWENARVVLATGWEYISVAVIKIPGEPAIYMINEEGARKRMLFSSIRFVFDAQGRDITALVISESAPPGEKPAPQDSTTFGPPSSAPPASTVPVPLAVSEPEPEQEWTSIRREREKSHFDRGPAWPTPFKVMVIVSAGYGTSGGDWFKGMTSGMLAGGIIRLRTSDKSYVGFSFNQQQLDVEQSLKRICEYGEYNCIDLDWDIRLDEYYVIWGSMSGGAMRRKAFLYLEVGIGAIRHKMGISASFGDESASGESSDTHMAGILCAGACIPFHRHFGLHLEGNMRATGKDYIPLITYNTQNIGGIFGCKLGFAVIL